MNHLVIKLETDIKTLSVGENMGHFILHLVYLWVIEHLRDYDDAAVVLSDGLGQRVDGLDILKEARFRFRLCLQLASL